MRLGRSLATIEAMYSSLIRGSAHGELVLRTSIADSQLPLGRQSVADDLRPLRFLELQPQSHLNDSG